MGSKSVQETALSVENVGGIDRTSVTFEPGVTVLAGRNATNRTSLLRAIMVAHASDSGPLKADAEEGGVTLTLDGDSYERRLHRENGTVTASGTTYLEDPELADLFAFLLEDNAARQAVERGDDLREVIMRPVDTDELEGRIRNREAERERIDEQLAEQDELERDLPDLEAERAQLEDEVAEKREELQNRRNAFEAADASVDEPRETEQELDAKLDELHATQSDLEDARYELETGRDALESLRAERADLEEEYEDLPEGADEELRTLEARLDDLHDRKQSITADLNQLQTIVQFNEEMLDSADGTVLPSLGDEESEDGVVTDQLVEDDTVTCWTCGSSVEEDRIEAVLEELRAFRQRKLNERRELESTIEDCQSEKRDLETAERRREEFERRLERTDEGIERKETRIDDLEARVEELDEQVDELEATVAELEEAEHDDLLEHQREVTQLDVELERLESDLQEVESRIESIEQRLDEREELEAEREEVQSDIVDLRTTVERLETEAVEQFNTHMEDLVAELEFENLARVWIERSAQETRRRRQTVSEGTFDLHVVRETENGTVYEDTVDHLSESEREVVGLVFALSGYLVHEVHESVPFMLLDSLEAIDADRIAALVDYFGEFAEYLVVALLPEDASALDDDYERLTEI